MSPAKSLSVLIVAALLLICSAFLCGCSREPVEWNGYDLVFKSADVLVDEPLPDACSPSRDAAARKKDKVILSWDMPEDAEGINGYVILRRIGEEGPFKELAAISPDTCAYTDDSVKGKGLEAFYVIVSYVMADKDMRISACAGSEFDPPERVYQNPSDYVQISDRISTHGYNYYTSPVMTDAASTREDCIEAMIETAFTYEGDKFTNRWSREPGKGVDCSGLVMQAAYGAGVDLWPSNPYRHRWGDDRYEWESRELAKRDDIRTVSYEERERGDLVFFADEKETVTHVAIYLGDDKIIHSYRKGGVCVTGTDYNDRVHICKIKRIFN